ncbi:AI-2E family transporter [Pseudoalteromonas sp. SSDWG2]|uniref:AI-2E family transporter n=1 Tax=Pseudoalteromonas sp. SSDWG2 TaxID=3139391 RepID=UPI003BAC79AD
MASFVGASKSLIVMASLVIVLAGVKIATPLVVPFILSVFIAIICSPLINALGRYRIPKGVAIIMVILLVFGLILSLAGLVGQSVNDFSNQLPRYEEQLKREFAWLVNLLANYNIFLDKEQIMSTFDPGKLINVATSMLAGFGAVMANLFLIIVTVVFMLFEGPSISKKVHLALNDPDMKMKQIDRFIESINSYLAIKTVISLLTGALVTLLLWVIGVDYFVLWGVVAFMLNYIPNIGSIIAAIPAVLLALITLSPLSALLVGSGYMIINMVMGNVVEPRYMGKGLGLSALVVFLSLIFWGWLLGSVGMLLSVPLTMVVKIALEESEEGRWLATLLSSDVEPPNDNQHA